MVGRWLLLVLACTGCPGLLLSPGNAYPCDFSLPPAERDSACALGDVCGVGGRCQAWRDEGIRFSGAFPTLVNATIHPAGLSGRVLTVARVTREGPRIEVMAGTADGIFRVTPNGVEPFASTVDPRRLRDVMALALVNRSALVGRDETGVVVAEGTFPARPELRDRVADESGPRGKPLVAARLRLQRQPKTRIWAITLDGGVGAIPIDNTPVFAPLPLASEAAIDVAAGAAAQQVVLLTTAGLRLIASDGGVLPLIDVAFRPDARLTIDTRGSVVAVVQGTPAELTSFELIRSGTLLEALPLFSTCAPCPALSSVVAIPGSDGRGPFVDVYCPGQFRRVRGSAGGACLLDDEAAAPIAIEQLARRPNQEPIFDEASDGFTAGGLNGQVWQADENGRPVPLVLDRVPTAVVSDVDRQGVTSSLAATSAGLFRRQLDGGYLRSFGQTLEASGPLGIFHDASRWAIVRGGFLATTELDAGFQRLPVINGRSVQVEESVGGVGLRPDGGLSSLLFACEDGLYATPVPPEPGELGPVLLPVPSTRISSFAVDLSTSDGVSAANGYVVAGRSLFAFSLGQVPLRWSASPVPVSPDEPVEVWFDAPTKSRGRVGFREGTVFSLPGGYQLTERLTEEGQRPNIALDYENLDGWPVVLATGGLYVATADVLPSGALDDRLPSGGTKPLRWRKLEVPDAPVRFTIAASARLAVTTDPDKRTQRLFLFLPARVIEVARSTR
jgi:hypothetical protein